MSETKRLVLIDGSGYIFRAFFALPPLTDPKGVPVGAVFGFCNMLFRLVQDMAGDQLVVVFDKGRASFRNQIYDGYKANRLEPPPELAPQFPLVREAAKAFGLPVIEADDYEADDLIATYARQACEQGQEVIVVSSDKDLMQLIGRGVQMYDPMKQKAIDRDEVIARFGVGPELLRDVLALAGDTSDNVPGVPGIGVKTAAQLLQEFHSLDELLANAASIKQPKRRENLLAYAEQARLSRTLVTLCETAPLPVPLGELQVGPADYARLLEFARTHGFRSLAQRVEPLAVVATAAAPRGEAPAEAELSYETLHDLERARCLARAGGGRGHRRDHVRDHVPEHRRGPSSSGSGSRSRRARPATCRSGIGTSSAPSAPANSCGTRRSCAFARSSKTRRCSRSATSSSPPRACSSATVSRSGPTTMSCSCPTRSTAPATGMTSSSSRGCISTATR